MIPAVAGQGGAVGGGGGGGLWTPAQIATALWLDADDASTFTLTGSDIDQWNDKSGNARHATPPGTKPTRNASLLNSMGGVVFASGTDPLLTTSFANPTGAAGITAVMVIRRTGQPVNFSIPLCKGAVNAQWSWIWANTAFNNISYWRHTTAGGQTATGPNNSIADATDYVWSGDMADAGITQYRNGTALSGAVGAGTRNFGASSALTIGSSPDVSYTANRFQGNIHEIVLLHTASATNRQLLEGYMAWRWGLQANLPGGHPYVSAAPTV